MNKKESESENTYHEIAPLLGLGTQLAATTILMFFLGRWLDSLLNLNPLLTIFFTFLGGAAGMYNFIKTVLNLNKKNKKDE